MGARTCAAMLVVDFVLSRFVSEDSMDDGGINEMLFRKGRFGIFLL